MKALRPLLAFLSALACAGIAHAVNFNGAYTESFDSMGTAGTTPPSGWSVYGAFTGSSTTWTSSIPASDVVGGTQTTALTAATAFTATSNTNGFNYALSSATSDRSLGTSPTTGPGVALQLSLTNTTGAAINALQVSYDIRRFTAATSANELPGYWLFYSLDNGATWTNVAAANPTITNVPNTTGVTVIAPTTITLGSAWASSATLLLRWMDDNSQQTSPDQVIGLDNVTVATPASVAGSQALLFNGNRYVTMGAATSTLGTSSLTVECWFKRTGTGTATSTGTGGVTNAIPLVTKGRGEADGSNVDCNYFLGIDATTNKLCADFEAQAGVSGITAGQNYPILGNTVIQNDTWYHVAVTYDTATYTWKLYLNGVQDATFTNPTGAVPRNDSIQHFGIGTALTSAGVPAGYFQGVIDEVRVWNIARSAAEIAAGKDAEIAIATTGLLARYGLNEGTGTSANNSVGTAGAPVGTLTNSPMWVGGAPFAPNTPPTVTLTSPTASYSGTAPATVSFAATASDSDGSIAKVEFYQSSTKVGEATASPYTFDWTNVAAGTYSLTAVAIDNGGASTTSTPVSITVAPNPNQPPVVNLTSPASNTTGIGSSVTLSASIADPEGDGQTVTFYGRQTTPAAAGPDFSLIAIPDTQFYSENANHNGGATIALYNAQTQWIVDNRTTRNIAFVSHMGDIVQNGDFSGNPVEWINADGAMQRIENPLTTSRPYGVPWGVAPGNHDQSPNGDASGTTTFYNQYFGIDRWAGRNYYGGHFGTRNNNNYELFSASGLDFVVLHLEYDLRSQASYQAVLDWANAVLQAYPNRRAIVTSHWVVNTGNPATFSTQGQNIYNALKGNPNLFLMLCGHVNGEGRRSDTYNGHTVYSILQDYQDITNGGNGFLRIYTFSPANNQITVESYSPTLGRAVQASDSVPSWTTAYTLPYSMQSAVTDWIPLGTVTVPPGGTTATLNWTGLEAGKDYEWFATSNDGVSTVSSTARRFSTTPAVAPTVALTSPTDGSSVASPATLNLTADASDADGTIARVEFYQGATKLGESTTAPYQFTWSNVAPGNYTLTAVAVDNSNLATLSSPVNVSVTTLPPVVAITSPADDATFDAPATFTITADASDPDGTIAKVEFFNGSTKLGEATTAPYSFTVTNAYTGLYFISAKATDNAGATTTSGVIEVFVTNTDNVAPSVALTAPSNGTSFTAGATVTLTASASDTDGTIAKVQFYQGTTLLGEDTTAPYTFDWATPAINGNYTITAVATDNDGGTTTSAPVTITLTPPPPFSYTQDFNSMGTSGTTLPSGWSMKNGNSGTTNATWTTSITANGTNSVAAMVAAAGALTVNDSPTATNNNGYNAAKPGNTADRMVATSPTSVAGAAIQLQLTNATGSSISALRIGYDIQRFTSVATDNELPGYWVFYSLDGGTTWTNIAALNPALSGATVNVPNSVGVTTVPLTSFSMSSPWANGATLLLRWVDDNAVATSPDQIVGLDNVTLASAIGTPPSSTLTAPANNSIYVAPATISLAADATDSDGTITKVEFYQGVTKIGEDTTAPYTFDWTGVPAGTYSLTAIATDNDGNPGASTPVTVTVNAAPGSGTLTRGPYLQKAAPTQITVRWRSSQSIAGRVQYGATAANLDHTVDEGAATTEHVVALTGLAPNTTYFYSVGSAFDTIASGATFTFTTPPTAGTPLNTRIWALGDAGTANSNQSAVRDAFYNWTGARIPNLVLQLGDNAYNSGLDTEFQSAVFDMYPTMLRRTPFWSCLGNHETAQATAFVDTYPYFNIYTFPAAGECGGVASGTEHYYSFDYGNIHFISLDSMTASRSPTGAMANWLATDLASTTATWIICFFHHPPYTKGSHDSDTEIELMEMRQNLLPILEAGGVDLVLSGHSHCYERSYLLDGHYGLSTTLTSAMKKNPGDGRPSGNGAYIKPLTGPRDHFGAVYTVAGSAGQTSGGALNHPAHYISLNNLGSLVLDINGARLDATFVKSDGSTPDTFTVIKQGAADSDGDGIPDEYEIAHGLNRFNAADATMDKDGDGISNRDEYLLGLSAETPDRYTWSTTVDPANGHITLAYPTLTGRNYRIWYSDDLTTWNPANNSVAGTGTSQIWTDDGTGTGAFPPPNGRRFYMVRVTLSP